MAASAQQRHSPQFSTDDARWQALLRRDRGADGQFYYSVATTGIYCRPACPARLPLRSNVRFHLTCAEAEQSGFRPCKRCRPNQAGPAARHAASVEQACRLIENAGAPPSLETLAAAVGLSRYHFHRIFKSITGITPKAYADAHRTQQVRAALRKSDTVTQAIYDSGFNSSGRFYAKSAAVLGMAPEKFRSGGSGARIRFAIGECPLGSILVAATDSGICSIALGDDPALLLRELEDNFPRARLIGADKDFEQWVARVVAFVEAPKTGLDLPLDLRGTAFQQRVWQALREIPAGVTASYAEVARRIGAPTAARAVASACASNTIAVAIPCHRVVRSDGTLSGYRWGVERKRALLEREAAK